MDAPSYPPSRAWKPPVVMPQPMSTQTSTLTDFFNNPEALAIFESELPDFRKKLTNPVMEQHYSNLPPRFFGSRIGYKSDAFDRIDAKLAKAGVMQRFVKLRGTRREGIVTITAESPGIAGGLGKIESGVKRERSLPG